MIYYVESQMPALYNPTGAMVIFMILNMIKQRKY